MDLGFLMLSLDIYVKLFFNFGSYQASDQPILSPSLRDLLLVPALASGPGYNNHQSNSRQGD